MKDVLPLHVNIALVEEALDFLSHLQTVIEKSSKEMSKKDIPLKERAETISTYLKGLEPVTQEMQNVLMREYWDHLKDKELEVNTDEEVMTHQIQMLKAQEKKGKLMYISNNQMMIDNIEIWKPYWHKMCNFLCSYLKLLTAQKTLVDQISVTPEKAKEILCNGIAQRVKICEENVKITRNSSQEDIETNPGPIAIQYIECLTKDLHKYIE